MAGTPDFSDRTKQILAKRAGQVCSNPACRKGTSGPHSDNDKALNLGEAAHIRGARKGSARYVAAMTDQDRGAIANGIWLCIECARRIDLDEADFPSERLISWKKEHEKWISERQPVSGGREVFVKNGGTGSFVSNEGPGIGLDIQHSGQGPAERIVVDGRGVGEIIVNTGQGTGKRVVSTGGGNASESHVIVDRPVNMTVGMRASIVVRVCDGCGRTFPCSKVIQGFSGDEEPEARVGCPYCGSVNIIEEPGRAGRAAHA